MSNILEDLWYGNIIPHETFMNDNPHFKKLISLTDKNYDKLIATLTELQKELLEKYDDIVDELHSLSLQTAFQYGFSLGVRLIVEANNNSVTNYR